MMWQDTIILICSLVFGFLLIPQIRDMYKEKTGMNILSCATTFSFLVVLSCVYATLSLPLAGTWRRYRCGGVGNNNSVVGEIQITTKVLT